MRELAGCQSPPQKRGAAESVVIGVSALGNAICCKGRFFMIHTSGLVCFANLGDDTGICAPDHRVLFGF